MFYLKLFVSTFYISAFTVGGGYVIIPLLKRKFVEDYQWIEENEMMDLAAIAQSAPGSVAVNASILIGYRLAGLPGVFITILGTVLPPFFIITLISSVYMTFRDSIRIVHILKGMQAAVVAVIADITIHMIQELVKGKQFFLILIMVVTFVILLLFQINIIFVILITGAIGGTSVFLVHKRNNRRNNNSNANK